MSPDHLYWEGLVIVTGNVDEIGLVVGTILVNAEPIAVIDLSRIIEGTPMQGGVFEKLQIHLYETGELSTWEAVERIYENSVALLKEGRIESAVLADPDYVTGYPVTQVEPVQAVPGYELARSVAGDPWGAEGSPWGAEGSPAEGGVVGAGLSVTPQDGAFPVKHGRRRQPGAGTSVKVEGHREDRGG